MCRKSGRNSYQALYWASPFTHWPAVPVWASVADASGSEPTADEPSIPTQMATDVSPDAGQRTLGCDQVPSTQVTWPFVAPTMYPAQLRDWPPITEPRCGVMACPGHAVCTAPAIAGALGEALADGDGVAFADAARDQYEDEEQERRGARANRHVSSVVGPPPHQHGPRGRAG